MDFDYFTLELIHFRYATKAFWLPERRCKAPLTPCSSHSLKALFDWRANLHVLDVHGFPDKDYNEQYRGFALIKSRRA